MELSPHIINKIFTEDEIIHFYELLENSNKDQMYISNAWGQKSWTLDISQNIIDKISNIIKNIYGDDWYLEIPRVARYDNSMNCNPYLDPHIDNFLDHRITLDIQLKSNIDWPITVDGTEFLLKDNDGLVFSGTKNVHWRPNRIFKDGEFVDLLFCHFRNKNQKYEISKEENKNRLLNLFKDREKYGYSVYPVSDDSFEEQFKNFEEQNKNNTDRMV